jgi:hypothetical protein
VIAAAEFLAAVLEHPHPAPFGAIGWRQFLKADDAVGNAVHRLVERVGGQVVEHHDGRVMLRKIMLERQDLPPIAQRALRQKADFRQAVEHYALRFDRLHGLENALGRFAKLEVRRIEQALLLILVEQVFGGDQLEDFDIVVECPAMRSRGLTKLGLGLRQGDVEPLLALLRASEQELRGDGRLAGAGAALDEIEALPAQAAGEHVVQPAHSNADLKLVHGYS